MENGSLNPVLHFIRQTIVETPREAVSDSQLLEQFLQRHDSVAFRLLMQRHGTMVLNVCRRILSCPHDAEDAFQATFLVLARKASSIGRRELLSNWLYGVALRTAQKVRRQSARWQSVEDEQLETASKDPPPLAELARHEVQTVLDEEVQRLPSKYRIPVLLCYFEGQTYTEAAEQIGCPAGTVSGRLARARDLLRVRLSRRGFALSASLVSTLLTHESLAAELSSLLVHSTSEAASTWIGKKVALSTCASAQVAALTEGVIRTMAISKLKALLGVFAMVCVLGVGGLALRGQSAAPPTGKSAASPEDKYVGELLDDTGGLPVPVLTKAQQLEKRLAELRKLDAEVRQLRQDTQKEALESIQKAIDQLKRSSDLDQTRAVSEFERAYRTLKDSLMSPPHTATGGRPLRRGAIDPSDFLEDRNTFQGGADPSGAGVAPGGLPSNPQPIQEEPVTPSFDEEQPRTKTPTRGTGTPAPSIMFSGSRVLDSSSVGARDPEKVQASSSLVGKVIKVSQATQTVEINLGSKQGLTVGTDLMVYRLRPQPMLLGRLQIIQVSQTTAVGRLDRGKSQAVRVEDIVSSIITN